MDAFIKIEQVEAVRIPQRSEPYYLVVLLDGDFSFTVDFNRYRCVGKHILFMSPYQLLTMEAKTMDRLCFLQFHGDFYCIEYHKEEVSCNGILFNNIYEKPFIPIADSLFNQIAAIFKQINELESSHKDYDMAIVRSYLQLVLALSSKEKQAELVPQQKRVESDADIVKFKALLDMHYREAKSVSFYAERCHLSVNALGKKVKKHVGKTPSKLLRERLTLEAKKLLHLTYKTVKEIAQDLGFKDEYYFSRYFKKEVGVSPKAFRQRVGISVVAKSSK